MDIRIERPVLNRRTAEENLAIVDRWIADTADKLNMYISNTNRIIEELKERENAGQDSITS